MIPLRALIGAVVVLTAGACSSATQTGTAAPAAGAAPATGTASRRSGSVISAQEAAGSAASNAYDLIRQLRPQWLVVRGMSSTGGGGIMVYVDGVRRGGLDVLQSIGIEQVGELRFLDANDATTRYGTGHVYGAIEVRTKR